MEGVRLAHEAPHPSRRGLGVPFVSLVLLAALLAGVNWFSSRHFYRKDLTANRAFSLSPQTRKVVSHLDRDIEVIAFYRTGDGAAEPVRDLGRQIADLSPRVRFEVVDPDRQPGRRRRRYPSLDYGVTVVDGGERTERVDGSNEAALVNAMIQVTRKEKKTIGFLTGHGEHDPTSSEEPGYSALTTRLESEGYAVEKLQLADQTAVPAEISVLVIAGPEKALFPNEQTAVINFLAQGGAAMLMSDPEPRTSLAAIAAPYGIEVGDDLVVDVSGVGKLFGADEFLPMGLEYRPHPIAEGFELTTVWPESRSVRAGSPTRRKESPPPRSCSPPGPPGPRASPDRARSKWETGIAAGPVSPHGRRHPEPEESRRRRRFGGRRCDRQARDAARGDRRRRLLLEHLRRLRGQSRPGLERLELALGRGRPDRHPPA